MKALIGLIKIIAESIITTIVLMALLNLFFPPYKVKEDDENKG